MSFPYERFLRFLVSRKADIRATLDRCGLDYPGSLWFSRVRSDLCATAPAAIVDHLGSDDHALASTDGVMEWATQEGVAALWNIQPEFGAQPSTPALTLAWRIFQNPFSRSILGLLIMSKVSHTDIRSILMARFDTDLNEAAIELYRSTFWDTSMVARKDWPAFVGTLRLWEERNMLTLAFTSPSIEEIRHSLDLPSEVDPEAVMRTVMNKAYQQFKTAFDSGVRVDESARAWGELAFKAAKEIRGPKAKGEDAAGAGKLIDFGKMFSVIPEKTKIMSYAEIQGEIQMPKIAVKSE